MKTRIIPIGLLLVGTRAVVRQGEAQLGRVERGYGT